MLNANRSNEQMTADEFPAISGGAYVPFIVYVAPAGLSTDTVGMLGFGPQKCLSPAVPSFKSRLNCRQFQVVRAGLKRVKS